MQSSSVVEQIGVLGREINSNQYKIVGLAAAYDAGLEWFGQGFPNPAAAIARALDIHTSTAHEWIRVGHALGDLPCIDEAFRSNTLSYAKTRILTRWADPHNEQALLDLAAGRSANRLTTAIAAFLAGDETEDARDRRHHENRSVTMYTDAEGMVVIRAALAPHVGKQVAEAINTIVRQVAATPADTGKGRESSADDCSPPSVTKLVTGSGRMSSADDSDEPTMVSEPAMVNEPTMADQLRELKQRWQPAEADERWIPSLAQQRADAFVLLFLGKNIDLTTEVVVHVRGDGMTFDDGTPITSNAICQRLDQSFIRLMIHDAARKPINASSRRRHPTTRQKRVVLETHNHECVTCQSTDLIELDHNPPFEQSRRTITTELEPRCAPCHRAHHRRDRLLASVAP